MQHSEASTEEILGIIKRVIERENREVAADEKRKRESLNFAPVMKAAVPSAGETMLMADSAADEVLELGDAELVLEDESAAANIPEEPVEEAPSLTSSAARQSVNDSFAALAMLARSESVDSSAPSESPLEGMVREMLRPMLAEWLDENLPVLVEKLVREEIDRIAGKSH